jgi:hypothetical protein
MSNLFSEPRVWIVQCMCPQRHCIMAVSSVCATVAELKILIQSLQTTIAQMIDRKALNPFCGICGCPSSKWRYESGRTRFKSKEEAEPALRRAEELNKIAWQFFQLNNENQ